MTKIYKLNEQQACELVARYLNGDSTHELADDFGISPSGVVDYVRRAGARPRTREENIALQRTHRTSSLHLSAGGSSTYVGGGDYDRGFPAVTYQRRARPRPTGLDWAALRPEGEPLTPSPPEIRVTRNAHTFVPDPDVVGDEEGTRVATRHQHGSAGSPVRRTRDHTRTDSKPRRGGPAGKLTDLQRVEIAARYDRGESSSKLAREFGVSGAAICYTVKRAGGRMRSKTEAMRLVWR